MAEPRPFVVRWREWLRDSDEHWATKHVGITMSLSMSSTGRGATMSLETLMGQTGLAESTVKRARRALVASEWVTCTAGGGRGNTNRYDARKPGLSDLVPSETGSGQTGSDLPKGGLLKPVLMEKGGLAQAERGPEANGNGASQTPEVGTTNETPRTRTTAPSGRKPDPIFDALIEACGLDPTQLTTSARGAINKACSDLRKVSATPALIAERAVMFRSTWPTMTLTPTALAKNWAQLAARQPAVVKDVAGASAWLQSKGVGR